MPEPTQLTFLQKPLVIGIAGCSGSGKTTLARELADQLDATLFPFDFYYRDLAHLPFSEREQSNFDHPDSLEHELLVDHVRELSEGRPVARPVYDFSTHTRVADRTDHLAPTHVVIVEGILALHYADLLPLYNFSIYVDAPNHVCLTRRIHRDVRERGRTEDSVRMQFNRTALPMAEQFVIPTQHRADITVSGEESLDWSIELILRQLHDRKLL